METGEGEGPVFKVIGEKFPGGGFIEQTPAA